jgi:cbb3-type cytochrome oxidase subunit 3
MAESIVTAVFSVTLSGIVYYVFSRILALPLGLSF